MCFKKPLISKHYCVATMSIQCGTCLLFWSFLCLVCTVYTFKTQLYSYTVITSINYTDIQPFLTYHYDKKSYKAIRPFTTYTEINKQKQNNVVFCWQCLWFIVLCLSINDSREFNNSELWPPVKWKKSHVSSIWLYYLNDYFI